MLAVCDVEKELLMKKLLWLCVFLVTSSAFSRAQNIDTSKKLRELPYKLVDANDVNVDANLNILFVKDGLNDAEHITGADIDGLRLKYERPKATEMLGFSPVLLIVLEFTDRETKERYLSFAEYFDKEPLYEIRSRFDLFVSVDIGFSEKAKLSSWVVVYGHLLADGKTVAVLDREKSSATVDFSELFESNRSSSYVDSRVNCGIDNKYLLLSLTKDDLDWINSVGE